ncbi:hypothetical protein [Mycobacterium sp.]|uniref:hypothetical protein n=1 Tax=Mycobacterium sp. TaxID=1785 RepID=UPI0025F8ACD1|nr:hypothetical protein [Mycobacterium sp.]
MTGPADDPSDRPTQLAGYAVDGTPVLEQEPDAPADAAVADSAPNPWYRNRVLLALWVLVVALLLTLVVYGIVELSRDDGTTGPAATTSSSTTPSRSSTTSATTTSPSTTAEAPPPSESTGETPEDAPPPANGAPAPAEPPRHHHHPHIPSTITLPHTVVTLPHGF